MDNEADDTKTISLIQMFSHTVLREHMPLLSDQLDRVLDRKRRNVTSVPIKANCPNPILPRNMTRIRFVELDPLELARQLTLMHAKLFAKITNEELLTKQWVDPDAPLKNVRHVIEFSERISSWVSYTILLEKSLDKRTQILKQFILIAEVCPFACLKSHCQEMFKAQ